MYPGPWAYAAFRTGGGGRILLKGDLNTCICFECCSIDALYDAIQDNKYPLALKRKLQED